MRILLITFALAFSQFVPSFELLSMPCAVAAEPTAEIIGPTTVETGQPALYTLKGLPSEHLDKFDWKVLFAPDDAMVLDLMDRAGNPVLVFWSRTPAKCAIVADVNIPPDEFQLIVQEFEVRGDEPDPKPDPDPDPKPDPDPNPATRVWAILLYESDDVDNQAWIANITTSQLVRRLADEKLALKFVDKDERDETGKVPPSMKPWIEYADRQKLTLPQLFFVDQDGALIAVTALPKTIDETVELIQRHKP